MGLTRIRAEQISDIDYKQAVRVVQTTNIALSGGAPSAVDGVNLSVNDRVLVTGQDTGNQNGLYRVQTLGTGANGTWVRTSDGNAQGEIESGMIVMVTEGEVYKDTLWKLTTNNPITLGSTSLTFELNTEFGFGNIYANGTGVMATVQSDVLTLVAGENMNVIGNAVAKTITFSVGGTASYGNANVVSYGETGWAGNIIPSANITYDLGSDTNRWKDIWLSNSTIYLGSAQISANATSLIMTNPDGGQTVLSGQSPELSANTLTATGNITGSYFIGNGSQLTGISTSTNRIFSGTSNVDIATANANVTVSVAGTSNVAVFSTSGLDVAGNITGNGISTTTVSDTAPANPEQGDIWIVGNTGIQLIYFTSGGNSQWAEMEAATSISVTGGTYGDSNVAAYLPTYTGNVGSGSGYIFGNGSQLTGLPSSYGNTNVAAYLSTYTGNLAGGNLIISSGIIYGSGAGLTNIPAANVSGTVANAAYSAQSGAATTANAVAGANVTGEVANAAYSTSSNAASYAGIVTTASQPNITSVGTLGSLTVTGNVSSGNVSGTTGTFTNVDGTLTTAAQTNITSVGTLGSLTVTGNITGGNLLGKHANGTSSVDMPAANGNVNLTAGGTTSLVVTSTGANITGTLNATGNANVGNLGATNIVGTLTTAAQTNITSVGSLGSLTVTGNVTSGNVGVSGLVKFGDNTTQTTAGISSARSVALNMILG